MLWNDYLNLLVEWLSKPAVICYQQALLQTKNSSNHVVNLFGPVGLLSRTGGKKEKEEGESHDD